MVEERGFLFENFASKNSWLRVFELNDFATQNFIIKKSDMHTNSLEHMEYRITYIKFQKAIHDSLSKAIHWVLVEGWTRLSSSEELSAKHNDCCVKTFAQNVV